MRNWGWLWVMSSGLFWIWSGCSDPIPDEAREDALTFEERLALEEDSIDSFIQEQGYDSVLITTSGLRMVLIKEGNDEVPQNGDIVSIDFTNSIMSTGRVFDTTDEDVAEENGIFIAANSYIPIVFNIGLSPLEFWDEGLPLISVGSKVIFVVPSHLAFGPTGFGRGVVPPNTIILSETSLVRIRK